jgi:hypothetical protein
MARLMGVVYPLLLAVSSRQGSERTAEGSRVSIPFAITRSSMLFQYASLVRCSTSGDSRSYLQVSEARWAFSGLEGLETGDGRPHQRR